MGDKYIVRTSRKKLSSYVTRLRHEFSDGRHGDEYLVEVRGQASTFVRMDRAMKWLSERR